MISVEQIKAARAMLSWSATELAARAGVGSATLKRYERQTGIPVASTRVLNQLKVVLEQHGIEFTGDPARNPGVTLRIKS